MSMNESEGLTRRETLKRGLLTGAALWVTPVVQVVGMRPAFAQTVSPADCDTIYAVKIEILEDAESPCGGSRNPATGIADEYCCEDISDQQAPQGQGQCLTVTTDAVSGGCTEIDAVNFVGEFEWEITLNEGCQYRGGQVAIKAGGDPCQGANVSFDPATRILTIEKTSASAPAISHVEFEFCCDH